MEDDDGDVSMHGAAGEMDPVRPNGAADLVSFDVDETDRFLHFLVGYASLAHDDTALFTDGVETLIHFRLGDVQYRATVYYGVNLVGSGTFTYAQLFVVEQRDGDEYRTHVTDLFADADTATGIMAIEIPRDVLIDDSGAPARIGHQFTDIWLETTNNQGVIYIGGNEPLAGFTLRDRMPDDGVGPIYDVAFGVVQEGDAFLHSDSPFRLSNGGATTIVYQVHAFNEGERQPFRLAVEDAPDGWDITLPYDRLTLDEDESASFPVLLTTPSGHQHGGAESFLLTMTGDRDSGDVGRLELGVKYADIPQPAGHHPKLWFHSAPYQDDFLGPASDLTTFFRFNDGLYMNAAEEDAADMGAPMPGYGNSIPGFGGDYYWFVPLQPFLQIGLDFETDAVGSISIPVQYDYIAQDVTLHGAMYVYSSALGDSVQVGQLTNSQAASWGPGQHTFEADLEILKAADFIPYGDEMFMWLNLWLEGEFIGPALVGPNVAPSIMPGGQLELPLNEYRDPLDTFYDAVRSLAFDTDYLERPVNPAETVIFETRLRNSEQSPQAVSLNITGVNSEWARIVGSPTFELGPGQERKVAVAVTVPSGVSDGALADLVLQAVSQEDANKRALVDLVALVDEETDHPDQASELESLDASLTDEKKSPGFEIAALLAGLLAIVLVMRRP